MQWYELPFLMPYRWSNLVEWMRYALYHKNRSTSADASEDHADLHSRITTLFTKGNQARATKAFYTQELMMLNPEP